MLDTNIITGLIGAAGSIIGAIIGAKIANRKNNQTSTRSYSPPENLPKKDQASSTTLSSKQTIPQKQISISKKIAICLLESISFVLYSGLALFCIVALIAIIFLVFDEKELSSNIGNILGTIAVSYFLGYTLLFSISLLIEFFQSVCEKIKHLIQ